MKIIPALFFVAVGVWLAFAYPEMGATAFGYIQYALDWVIAFFQSLVG